MIFYLIIFHNEFDTFLPIKWPVGGKSSLKGCITSCIPLVHSLLFICSTWLTSKSHLGNYRDVWLHTYCNMLSWMVNECTVNQYKVSLDNKYTINIILTTKHKGEKSLPLAILHPWYYCKTTTTTILKITPETHSVNYTAAYFCQMVSNILQLCMHLCLSSK